MHEFLSLFTLFLFLLAISKQLPINRIFSIFSKPFRTKSPHRTGVHVYSLPKRIVKVSYIAMPHKFLRRDQQCRTEIRTKKRSKWEKSRESNVSFSSLWQFCLFSWKRTFRTALEIHTITLTLTLNTNTRARIRNGKSKNRVKTRKEARAGRRSTYQQMKSVTCDVECGSECQHS